MKGIVGREAEIRELQERYSSDRAQFVAVYVPLSITNKRKTR